MVPHGGKLVNRVVSEKRREKISEEMREFTKIEVETSLAKDIENIAYGVFSPLEGFLLEEDYLSVLDNMRLSNDIPWTIPIVLDVNDEFIEEKNVEIGDYILLISKDGMVAGIEIEEIYDYSKDILAEKVFLTRDLHHPGVKKVYTMKDKLIGGRIDLFIESKGKFDRYALKPMETRVLFKELGWRDIVAFQTRNAPHIGHEFVQKTALTFVDGIFINPLVGEKKKGDFRDEVIVAAYETLIKNYFLKERAVLAVLQTSMRYAGPREAVHHAIMRKNFGCTHFIVGRDHAGVGNYYPPYAAHDIFEEFPDLGIVPLFFRSFFWCEKCKGVMNEKTCPHDSKFHESFSGTKIRAMFEKGELPSEKLMRREVAETILSFDNIFVE